MVRQDRSGQRRPPGPLGRAVLLVLGGVWCWAVFRLILQPGRTGFMEGLVAAGGWGLSLLPVHCAPRSRAGPREREPGGLARALRRRRGEGRGRGSRGV